MFVFAKSILLLEAFCFDRQVALQSLSGGQSLHYILTYLLSACGGI